MEHDVQMWLLVLTLFFPRIGLIIAWFAGQIPYNTIPFVGDAFLAVFLPRLLMTIYIAGTLGTGSGWFWVHLILFILSFVHHTSATHRVISSGKDPWDYRSWMPERS